MEGTHFLIFTIISRRKICVQKFWSNICLNGWYMDSKKKKGMNGRNGGLMVRALDSGSSGPGSSPGRGTALCSCARHFTLIVPFSIQVYK